MRIKFKLLFLASALTLTSCWDPNSIEPGQSTVDPNENLADTKNESFDFKIPEGFEWENFQTINSKVSIYNRYASINNSDASKVEYGVEIYDGEDLIDAGVTKNGVYASSFTAKKGLKNLIIVQKDPSGATARAKVALVGSNLTYDFISMVAKSAKSKAASYSNEATDKAPDAPAIPANAIEMVDGMTLEENGIYCISAGNVINNVKLDKVSGVKIYVAGEYNTPKSSWFDAEENFSIYVLESGKFTASELYSSKYKNIRIENYGEFTTAKGSGKIQINGTFINAGKLTIGEGDGELFLLEDSIFDNFGELKAGDLGLSKGVELRNYGEVELTGKLWSQGSAFKLFENRNDFHVKGNVDFAGGDKIVNYHRIESDATINIHGVGEVVLNPYSMIKANKLDFQRTNVISKGDAIIKVVEHLYANYSSTFVGDTDKPSVIYGPYGDPKIWFSNTSNMTDKWIIDPDPNIWGANWGDDVVLGNSGYVIAATPSNDGGYNSDQIDEIPDGFENIEFATAPKIVIFEDNYPNMGDCDFNDIVMMWNLRGEKDANDIVKELYLDVTVKSCGAGRKVGAGVRIHSLASKVSSATIEADDLSKHSFDEYFAPSNGVEADVNGVVVPLFESIHSLFGLELGSFINVSNIDSLRCEYYNFSVKLDLDTDMTSNDINLENFDFFITNSVNKKGRAEIHTFGNDVSLYANNEITFKNPSAVWGIELPKDFLHSIEHHSIVLAYPAFQTWIESAGTSNLDWYKYSEEGFVVKNN